MQNHEAACALQAAIFFIPNLKNFMSNDTPLTNAEEDQVFGAEVTPGEMQSTLARQLAALDAEDCASVAADCAERILSAFHDDSQLSIDRVITIGTIVMGELQLLAQRRANIELYGKVKA